MTAESETQVQTQSTRTAFARSVLGERNYERALNTWIRLKQRPRVGGVNFGDLRRLEPICRAYGYDRGRPIDRYYIENFLERQSALITGRVLEIGERIYTEAFGHDVTRSDMLHVHDVEGATYVADLSDAPDVPSDTFDCVIITQTLHVIYDMRAVVDTLHRILKPGGVVLCTVPGITQIADPTWRDTWYWSLSEASAKRLFEETFEYPNAVDVRVFGNVLSATAFLHGLADKDLKTGELDVYDPEYPVTITVAARKLVVRADDKDL